MQTLLPTKDLLIPPSILTQAGTYFAFSEPEKYTHNIRAIAHSLSHLCRFNGHVNEFYSVAQHSVMVSYLVPPEFAFQGLMHDTTEAYIGDMSSPLKSMFPEYKALERRIWKTIAKFYGMPEEMDRSIHEADLIALATEKRDLLVDIAKVQHWISTEHREPVKEIIVPVSCVEARSMFLARFYELQFPGA